ncbi:MAG: ferritin family protein [Candidatus Omnitrophica bacterium]|nr:ferritin family protein [Candidatus Omnitrophota bacterium]
MGNIFSGSEIVEIGIQIEVNGRDFYSSLAKRALSPKAAKIFNFLAGEEERHILIFQKILEKVEKYEPQGLDADEYYAYMSSLAKEYVFTQKDIGAGLAAKIKSDKEAADVGISHEKDSIIFYEGMRKTIPEYAQGVISELIQQEEEHLKQLLNLKKGL